MLNTPSIYAVDAFDPTYSYTFNFSYSGTQATSNRAIIIDSETQEEVYNVKQDGLKLNHVLPANTLTAGKSYIIQIQVYDAYDNYSYLSSGVLFYCYSTPQFYFSNINDGDTISSANFELKLSYDQQETELLNEYKYYVYDITKSVIYMSESFYSKSDMSHIIHGLKNNYIYYVRAIGKTIHGMNVDTGMIEINIRYKSIPSNIAFEAINDNKTGCIILKTNIISVGYKTENNNYTIENGMVNLIDNTLTYEINTEGDFSLIIKAKKLPIGTFCWTTYGNISVSIECISDKYYCHLCVKDNMRYDIFKIITGAVLVDSKHNSIMDSNQNYISIVDQSNYDNDTMIVFQIYRKNNRYDIFASYE